MKQSKPRDSANKMRPLTITFSELIAASYALFGTVIPGALTGGATGAAISVFYLLWGVISGAISRTAPQASIDLYAVGAIYGVVAGVGTGAVAAIWCVALGGRWGGAISGALSGILGGLGMTRALYIVPQGLFDTYCILCASFFVVPPAVAGYLIGQKQGRIMVAVCAGQSGGSPQILAKLRQAVCDSPLYRFPVDVRLLLALYQTIVLMAPLYYLYHWLSRNFLWR